MCGSTNHVYFLCLIDWGKILTNEELAGCTEKIIPDADPEVDGWAIRPLVDWPKLPELADIISKAELGFYHSRLIFKLELKSTPKNLQGIRQYREKLESKIEDFCLKKIIPVIKSYSKSAGEPFIFTYPIFELNRLERFWKFEKRKPYSLPTTCFFTELNDPKGLPLFGRTVKMRISGAKVIASDMSSWFFENLVGIIFHEGLYRQTRDKKRKKLPPRMAKRAVYNGLENRLEDFAYKLMTTFHEYSSENIRRRIAWIALFASGIGILITLANFLVNYLRS